MIKIYLEDITSGAFEYILSNTDIKALTLHEIEQYGKEVINNLKSQGIEASLELDRERTEQFFIEHQTAFTKCLVNGKIGVSITSYPTMNYIYEKIYGSISLPVLQSFWSESATEKLTNEDNDKQTLKLNK